MHCHRCGREIPEDANLCPYCGEVVKRIELPQPPVPPSMSSTKMRKTGRTPLIVLLAVVSVIILACIGCFVYGQVVTSSPTYQATATARASARATIEALPTNTPLPTSTPTPTSTPIPTATPAPLTYQDIERNYETMTDMQWDSYYSGIIGTRVRWRGKVTDVDEDGTIFLDVGQELFHSCFLNGVPREVAATINKGDYIEFEATITDITTFLGLAVWLDNPVLISISGG